MGPNKKCYIKKEEMKPDDIINEIEPQVNYDDANGFIIENKLIPEELLAEIFKRIDNKTLLWCHLVCKQWHKLIKKYVWRKKAEYVNGKIFPADDKVPWTSYYYLCGDWPFGKNLLYNKIALPAENNGNVILTKFERGEDIPVDITPFPEDDSFHGNCIITSTKSYSNKYIIDLVQEGFTEHLLDTLQPTVNVCEWHAIKKRPGHRRYSCSYKMLKVVPNGNFEQEVVMRQFLYDKGEQKVVKWTKFHHYAFKNYGEGLRKIRFFHGSTGGVVMVGASVSLEINMYHSIPNRKISSFAN